MHNPSGNGGIGSETGRHHSAFQLFWLNFHGLYDELKVCRFSFIVAFVALLIFWKVPQGVEILRALAEQSTLKILGTGANPFLKWTALISGTVMWGIASWYSSRVLLYVNFPARREPTDYQSEFLQKAHPILVKHVPRVLGVAPFAVLAFGFLNATGTYPKGDPARTWLFVYAAACVVMGALLYRFFAVRRRWVGGEPALRWIHKPWDLPKETKFALMYMAVVTSFVGALLAVNPVRCAAALGTAGILVLAAAFWAFWGSVAVYVASWFRFPVVGFLLVWAAVCSFWNDNHYVRQSPPIQVPMPAIDQAFDAWYAHVSATYPNRTHPLFLVTSEGGGVRAAYWTATVLGTLQDKAIADQAPDFADHVFAISSVSGGSVGAAVFDAALLRPPGAITGPMQKMLGSDFLAPVMGAMLYPDFAARFVPFPVGFVDRGKWLEVAWETACRDELGNDAFAGNFQKIWEVPKRHMPALLLNGTSVESGQRVLATNLQVGGWFLDALNGGDKSAGTPPGTGTGSNIPLSTAAHNSARFTYVSPAGRFPDGTHVVDGGYFENSGSTTAVEVLREIEKAIMAKGIKDVRPMIITISNNPLASPYGGRDLTTKDPAVKLDERQSKQSSFLIDAIAPLSTLLATWGSHDSYAQLNLKQVQRYQNVIYFGLSPSDVPLPLGWMLSGTAAAEMNRQMGASMAEKDGKNNPGSVMQVMAALKATPPLKPFSGEELLELK